MRLALALCCSQRFVVSSFFDKCIANKGKGDTVYTSVAVQDT